MGMCVEGNTWMHYCLYILCEYKSFENSSHKHVVYLKQATSRETLVFDKSN